MLSLKHPLLFFILLSILSCSPGKTSQREEFSVKNQSPDILTVTLSDESSIKMIRGFCFKFLSGDFPLTVSFNEGSVMTLNRPAHYLITGHGEKQMAAQACQSERVQ